MELHAEMTYPGASPDEVFAMVTDPGFRAEVCRETRAIEQEVHVAESAEGGAVVSLRRVMTADVPAMVRSFVGEQITIQQTEEWGRRADDGSRQARLTVRFTGQPATIDGSIRLEAGDGGSKEVITGEATVSIPFVGRMVEPELVKGIVAAAEVEERLGRRRLTTAR